MMQIKDNVKTLRKKIEMRISRSYLSHTRLCYETEAFGIQQVIAFARSSVILYIIGVMTLLSATSCMDEENFSVSKTDLLTFSTDTVKLDTTFSNVPTPTKSMWVYNRTGKAIRCSDIRLEGGNQEGFRVNVDGTFLSPTTGYQNHDVEIRKGDSVRVFVELTSVMQQEDEPQLVQDNLVFTLESGVQQKVNLRAMSWDAEFLRDVEVKRGENLVLGAATASGYQKPIVVYGGITVDSLATLTIKEGTTLFFHEDAGIKVYGTLKAVGTVEKPITMRGDRIDHLFDYLPYDRTPGQWQGIRLMSFSRENEFAFTDIHSAYDAVLVDSCDVTIQKLLVQNSTIHNCQGYGVRVDYAKAQFYNTQISNTLDHCLYVWGGDVEVNNCTIAQFYPFDARRGSAIGFMAPIDSLKVKNSLVTGYADDEVVWTPVDDQPLNFSFDHCVLRTEKMDSEDSLKFTNVIYEDVKDTTMYGEKHFVKMDTDNFVYDFRLSAKSAAIGAADATTSLPFDRNGLKREGDKADAGCYLYREEKNEE